MSAIDDRLAQLREAKDCELVTNRLVTPAFLPIPPHRVGIAHLALKPRFLLADPTGTGKTPQALVAYAHLKVKHPPLKALVVTTRSALFQWQGATARFLDGPTTTVLGYDADRQLLPPTARALYYTRREQVSDDIYIINYHLLARDLDLILPLLEQFVLVLDEVHHLRGRKQQVLFPTVQRVSLKARYVWGLSATPIMNRVEDIYAVMEAIAPGFWGSWSRFGSRYLDRMLKRIYIKGKERRFWEVRGPKNLPELMDTLRPFYLKRPAAEIHQFLPEIVPMDLDAPMDDRQQTIYHGILQQYFDRDAPNRLQAITALLYAQEAADDPALLGYTGYPSAKQAALDEFLDGLDQEQRVLIYTRFAKMAALLHARHGGGRITGDVSAAERNKARLAFLDGTHKVLFMTAAGGEALDLQAANIVVFYDLPWSYGEYLQVLGRARRIGSAHPSICVVHLMARDGRVPTIDGYAHDVLKQKQGVVLQTFGTADEHVLVPAEDRLTMQLYQQVRGSR